MSLTDGLDKVALKPKLLRSLMREYVPDERHPWSNPSELCFVVSTIKTHKLLSESTQQPIDQNLSDTWKSTVDSWLNRLHANVSSGTPDKCWAGLCLLGFTSQECSSERFLSSYVDWLNKLLSQIQHPGASHLVKAASCASISDLFTRLSGFANARKDATSHATRVIPPVLKLINEDSSPVVLEEAVCLVCTLIKKFPLSVQRHYDTVEAAVVSKLLSGKSCAGMLKLGYVLSLHPKSKGDADSWSLMMDKILVCINNQLTDALQGLEEESRSVETMRALLPSGKESPTPLGGLAVAEQISDLSARRPERLLGSRISALMQCCCHMLTNSYPVMVHIPIRGLISLVERVLLVDGSLLLSSYAFMTTMKHEFICSEIPLLQLHSLKILAAAVKGLSSKLLPHCARIVQLLNEYLRRCKFPDLRISTYSIIKELLLSMGMGFAIHLNQDIVSNVLSDFFTLGDEKDGKSPGTLTKVHTESRKKKRKHSSSEKFVQEHHVNDGLEGAPHNSTPIYLKIAALEALEVLLTVGGCMRSERWRGDVDCLLINVVTNACKGGFSAEKRLLVPGDPASAWEDFQLSVLRALLASLLSPGHVCPPYLGLSLDLFCRGMQGMGTKVAEYCRRALLALEVLIHPRGLPLLDMRSCPDGYNYQSHVRHDRQFSTNLVGMPGQSPNEPESEDDDFNEKWFGNDDEVQVQDTAMQHRVEEPSATAGDPSGEKSASIIHVLKKDEMIVSADILKRAGMTDSNDDMLVSSVGNKGEKRAEVTALVDGQACAQSGTSTFQNMGSERKSLDVTVVESNTVMKSHVASEQNVMEMKDDRVNTIVERLSATLEHREKGELSRCHSDSELSTESIPDIVDGDPDSD